MRSFLSQRIQGPKILKTKCQSRETLFDFGTFLSVTRDADIGRLRSIRHIGLQARIRRVALSDVAERRSQPKPDVQRYQSPPLVADIHGVSERGRNSPTPDQFPPEESQYLRQTTDDSANTSPAWRMEADMPISSPYLYAFGRCRIDCVMADHQSQCG